MTAINRTPVNTNYLQPTKFTLTFSRMPTVTYFCQEINLPGVSTGQAPINFPGQQVYAPGNQLKYNDLNVVFTINEDMQSWKEVYNWLLSFASPLGTDQRNLLTQEQNSGGIKNKEYYSDATLTILSALNNPVVRINFINIFPISLSDLQFDTKLSADTILTASSTFVYERFEFLPV